MGTHNHCVPYWKTTLRTPCLPGPHPLLQEHKQPLCEQTNPLCESIKQPPCGHTDPLCGCIHLKKQLENNYQSPMFSSPPPSTYTTTDIHIHCVSIQIYSALINSNHCRCPLCVHTQSLCTLLENNFQGPMFIKGSPYKTTHITTVWAHTTTMYPTGKQLSRPRVYQGRPPSSSSSQHNQPLCEQTKPLCGSIPL